ncbi:MAG: periplasmic heavy metal sensor [Tateyamaria sp.]
MADTNVEKRCPLWVKIVLAASLAINLLIVGLVAGLVLRGGPLGGKGPAIGYAMPYVLALPQPDRRKVFDTVRNDPELPGRRERRAAYDDMVTLLRADTFDRAAVEVILARQQTDVSRVQTVAQAAWLDVLEAMPLDERQVYATRVEEVARKRPGNRAPKKNDN